MLCLRQMVIWKKQLKFFVKKGLLRLQKKREGLLLKDILLTQKAVLSAMLYAAQETGNPSGVLMTDGTETRRESARPMPERDLWFERVWKKCREEREHGSDA